MAAPQCLVQALETVMPVVLWKASHACAAVNT